MFPGVTEVAMTQWRNSKDWKKTLNYTRTTSTTMQINNSFGNSKKHPDISGVCEVSFVPSPRLLFFFLLWLGVFPQTNDSVSKYNSMTFQGLYPPQKLKGAWHGESECGRKMFGKNLSVFAPALALRSGTYERGGRYFIYDSYSVPMYRFLYCTLSYSNVPRYLAYSGTWLSSVSWPILVCLGLLQ